MNQARFHILSGKEQNRYTQQLDSCLKALAQGLDNSDQRFSSLKQFGDEQQWNWNRVPLQQKTYQSLARMVEKVRENYQWFQWRDDHLDPIQNCAYFDKIEVGAESGLPWLFQMMELHRAQQEAPKALERLPSYQKAALSLQNLLLTDYLDLDKVKAAADAIHLTALNRNYLELLQSFGLLAWDSSELSSEPQATKLVPLGVEDLWSISLIRYSPGSGLFHAYLIDLWQDRLQPQITEIEGTDQGMVSSDLQKMLKFSEENAAWYILKTIDQRFPSLHPIHVSRAIIGPFENKYLTQPTEFRKLPLTDELIKQDQNVGLLRFNRQYSYAPNKELVDGISRQIISTQNWNDEIIVCPGAYSSAIAQSILGTDIRIFKT